MPAIAPIDAYYLCPKENVYKEKFKYAKHIRVALSLIFIIIGIGESSTTASSSTVGSYVYEITRAEEIIQSINPLLDQKQLRELTTAVMKWSSYFELDPKLVYAILHTESGFDPTAMSSAGAVGLMQVMMKTHMDKVSEAKKIVGDPNPFGITSNVYMGTKILKACDDKFRESDNVLKCYNGSYGKTTDYPSRVKANMKRFANLSI